MFYMAKLERVEWKNYNRILNIIVIFKVFLSCFLKNCLLAMSYNKFILICNLFFSSILSIIPRGKRGWPKIHSLDPLERERYRHEFKEKHVYFFFC